MHLYKAKPKDANSKVFVKESEMQKKEYIEMN